MIAYHIGRDETLCKLVYVASPLHDVGDIGIPDSVYLKTGKIGCAEMGINEDPSFDQS